MSVTVFDDADALADAAADRAVVLLRDAIAERGRATIALSGGGTPRGLYERLGRAPRLAAVDWQRVFVFFVDERAVPPTDPESNFRLARETLIDPAGIPPRNVHRMKGEYPDLAVAVEEYEAHVPPALDLLILGIGPDGHTASLFPGSPLLFEHTRRVASVEDSPKPPPRRLTLTPLALEHAREGIVLVTGADKADAVARAQATTGDVSETPARLIRMREWMLDHAAAAALARPLA